MKAMVLDRQPGALELRSKPVPVPSRQEVLLKVAACAVCRTDLHIVDGELNAARLPLVPGHEVIGIVEARGEGVNSAAVGDRVGVPWLAAACGDCFYCRSACENLCDKAVFTGYQRDGGFAEYATADARYCLPIPPSLGDAEAAPLLCAGLIGYRALRRANDAQRVGLYGFGAAAHLAAQVLWSEGRQFFAFTRPGDRSSQDFARGLGAEWAGGADELPPSLLDAALIFAPVGALVPAALRAVRKGGTVICAGIHMSAIPAFSYDLLWGERTVTSVANLTRADGAEFFQKISRIELRTSIKTYELEEANLALDDLRAGRIEGAAVLVTELGRQRLVRG